MEKMTSHIETHFLWPKIMLGASESIDVLVLSGALFSDNSLKEVTSLADSRLRLRCILTHPEAWIRKELRDLSYPRWLNGFNHEIKRFSNLGWDVRVINTKPTMSCLLVDGRELTLADLSNEGIINPKYIWYYAENEPVVNVVQQLFERVWDGQSAFEPIYEDTLLSSVPENSEKIIISSRECWDDLIAHLVRNPQKLYDLPPRNFEELVAELLLKEGMKVELTKPSKDGGRDIIAMANTATGRHLYLVECKRFKAENPVGVRFVRMLYGIVEAEKATGGILVTTSSFTKGAKDFQKTVENRLWLKDNNVLLQWLGQY